MCARASRVASLAACLPPALAASPVWAQSPFATQVVSFQQGGGSGSFDTQKILGGPLGAGLGGGSLDVLTLGEGGTVTLGFDLVLHDGPGADFTVFENGFVFSPQGDVFAELAFVEVSSDGVAFARFPTRYAPPLGGGNPMGTSAGLTGGAPVIANVATAPESPFDPVTSGGEAFDLADLAGDPTVVSGDVDLAAIRFVRLVDVAPGDVDSFGTPIPSSVNADIDAVAVLNHTTEPAGHPVCDLAIDAQGFLVLRLGDPDGFFDLDFATLSASASLVGFSFLDLLPALQVTAFDGNLLTFRSTAPVPSAGVTALLAVSVRDLAGTLAGDQVALQN